jgi:Capsular polysaccharide synthesis protein
MNKTIWSFWTGEDETNLVAECQISWKKFCPDWTIRFLDEFTVFKWLEKKDFPSNFDELTPTTQSDLIRLALLIKYGGLWVDATSEFASDLKWLEDFVNLPENGLDQYYGFFWGKEHPENHFLYSSQPGNPSIANWLAVLLGMMSFHPDFSKSIVYTFPDSLATNIEKKNYFMCYAAYLYCQSPGVLIIPPFAPARELPLVFEFFSHLIPTIPGVNRHFIPSFKKIFGNKTKVYKYTNECRKKFLKSPMNFYFWGFVVILITCIVLFFRELDFVSGTIIVALALISGFLTNLFF